MHAFRAHPARRARKRLELRDQFADRFAHRIRQVESDEQSHRGVALIPPVRGIGEVAANRIERCVRGVGADAIAVSGEAHRTLAWAAFVGDANVDQANGLFGCAAARPGDARDAHSERRPGASSNAVGER